jgi:hypothetical protein
LYGTDTDADGVPEQYRSAAAVADWQQVVSLRITVSVAGSTPTELSPANARDVASGEARISAGRVHRSFTTVVQIRNLLRT